MQVCRWQNPPTVQKPDLSGDHQHDQQFANCFSRRLNVMDVIYVEKGPAHKDCTLWRFFQNLELCSDQ